MVFTKQYTLTKTYDVKVRRGAKFRSNHLLVKASIEIRCKQPHVENRKEQEIKKSMCYNLDS